MSSWHLLIQRACLTNQATMGVRLPTILGKAIDDVWKTLNQESEEERIVDLVACIHRLEDLMDDLQKNAKLRPIIDDGAGDIALWNKASWPRFFPSHPC